MNQIVIEKQVLESGHLDSVTRVCSKICRFGVQTVLCVS